MPLVEWICKKCGGEIDRERRVCPYCDTPYSFQIDVDNNSLEAKLNSAEIYLTQIKNYEQAHKLFMETSKIKPDDYRCWWGLARVETKNFTLIEIGQSRYNIIKSYVDNALMFVPPDKKSELIGQWGNYVKKRNEELKEYERKGNQLLKTQDAMKKGIELQLKENDDKILQEQNLIDSLHQQVNVLEKKKRFWDIFSFGFNLSSIGSIGVILFLASAIVLLHGVIVGVILADYLMVVLSILISSVGIFILIKIHNKVSNLREQIKANQDSIAQRENYISELMEINKELKEELQLSEINLKDDLRKIEEKMR